MSITPSLCGGTLYVRARYFFSTCLEEKSFINIFWISCVFAVTRHPLVSLSSLCTIPGRVWSSKLFAKFSFLPTRALTMLPFWFPAPGWTMIPGGLFITSIESSSYMISSGIFSPVMFFSLFFSGNDISMFVISFIFFLASFIFSPFADTAPVSINLFTLALEHSANFADITESIRFPLSSGLVLKDFFITKNTFFGLVFKVFADCMHSGVPVILHFAVQSFEKDLSC